MKSQTIPALFEGDTAVLFATGPSLTPEVIETVRPYWVTGKVRAFGCNDCYSVIDYLDVHYACDGAWWDKHPDVLKTLPPDCHVWTQEKRVAEKLGINYIAGSHDKNLCTLRKNHIHFGSNSGFQQLNIAYHYGIEKFLLVGYNMQMVDGKRHYFGDHPQGLSQTSPYNRFVEYFNSISDKIKERIINCTPNSALTEFQYMDLKEALECL